MRIRLDHVVIHVSDCERSNAFYEDVLCAELIEKGDGGPSRPDLCFVWDGSLLELISYHR